MLIHSINLVFLHVNVEPDAAPVAPHILNSVSALLFYWERTICCKIIKAVWPGQRCGNSCDPPPPLCRFRVICRLIRQTAINHPITLLTLGSSLAAGYTVTH